MIPVAAALVLMYLLLRGSSVRMVNVITETLEVSEGFVGDNGSINQPVYGFGLRRVEAPQCELIFKTPKGRYFSESDKPTAQFGVVFYSVEDDGRRVITRDNDVEVEQSVFESRSVGYYVVQYTPDYTSHSILNPYGSTGLRDWVIREGTHNGEATPEASTLEAERLYANAIEPRPESVPEDDDLDDGEVDPSKPSIPTLGGSMGSISDETGQSDADVALKPSEASETSLDDNIVIVDGSSNVENSRNYSFTNLMSGAF
jgi:hypothetical protein